MNVTNVPASSTGCYTILRTYTLTDDCGNSTDIEQIITVEDNTAPIYQGPEISILAEQYDVAVLTHRTIWAYPSIGGTASIGYIDDRKGSSLDCRRLPDLRWMCQPATPHVQRSIGHVFRVLTITDLCGNSSTAEVINLIDDDAPVFDFVPGLHGVLRGRSGAHGPHLL